MLDEEGPVELDAGELDGTFQPARGTTIRLSDFLPKRVPTMETFKRQLARRFAFAEQEFVVRVHDSRTGQDFEVPKFEVPVVDETRIDVATRPVVTEDGEELPVAGWIALAKQAYRDEEMAGVRIYARQKIVATTRDFEQPAGFTGEFTLSAAEHPAPESVARLHAERAGSSTPLHRHLLA